MSFKQRHRHDQKPQVAQSPQLIKAIGILEKSEIESQDQLELMTITISEPDIVSSEGEISESSIDGRVYEDVDWDYYCPVDETILDPHNTRKNGIKPSEDVLFEFSNGLWSHLMLQLLESRLNPVQKEIGSFIIGNLDEKGYLDISIEEQHKIAQKYQLDTWHETLKLIQQFDPPGVAARDLQECLLIQVKRSKINGADIVYDVIKYHWNNLLKKKFKEIAENLVVPLPEIHNALSIIAKLDTRPGLRFNKKVFFYSEYSNLSDSAFHIIPDFFISKENGAFRIKSSGTILPSVLSSFYHDKSQRGKTFSDDELARIANKLKYIKSLYRRHEYTQEAIKSILKLQKDFFESGSEGKLRPLVSRDITEDVDLDESTIRRLRKNKYIDTHHGVFELEFFFDRNGYETSNGGKIASKGVKFLISQIIQSENKDNPFSDQEIAGMLENNLRVNITLKTVRNYREKLGYLDSRMRKRFL